MTSTVRGAKDPASDSQRPQPHPTSNVRTWTRKALWQAVENDRERTCSLEEFAGNLMAHREALLEGVKWYKQPNAESRKKMIARAERPKADFVVKMSVLMDLDELQCEAILETCIKDDIEAPAVRRRIDWSQVKEINYEDEKLVVAVQQQYLNEREETLLALAAIIRAADDEDHRFHDVIRTFVRDMFQDSEAAGKRLLDQLLTAIRGHIPSEVAADTEWACTWAIQYVKEQRILLQVIFLIYYSVAPCPPSTASSFICTIVDDFDFGRNQSNESLLDEETSAMGKHIADLCVMVSIELMRVSELIDAESVANAPFVDSPGEIEKIYLAIEKRAAASHGRGDPIGPVILAWGVLLQTIYPALEGQHSDEYAQLFRFINEKHVPAGPSPRLPQMLIQQAYLNHQAVIYIVGALRGPMVVDEHVALGYKSVMKDLMILLLETVSDAFTLPDRETLVTCMSLLFANEEQLSLEWWEHDYELAARRSLLDAARRAFPIDFVPFIELLTSLISSARTGAFVFRYFKALPTLADHYRPYDYVEDPFCEDEMGTNVYRWKGNSQGIVYGARDIYLEPPGGTIGQQVNFDPPILLLRFTYSGWHLLLSIMDSFLHGAGTISGHQLEYCTSGTPEAVTEILNLFNTFLEHTDDDLLSEFMSHIADFTTKSPTWREKTTEHFVGLICQVLNRACTFASPPIKLLTSCMTCLAMLLPYFPDAVWKHLRVDGLFPRYSSSIRLSSTNSYMEEVLLPAEIAAGRYPTTMAFLDLVSALIKDAQTLRPQDAPLTPAEQALEAEFWEARRNPRLMEAFDAKLGGTENRLQLERKLVAHAKSRDSSILRSEVLFSAVIYIHSQVFPKHGTWRYVHLQRKYQLGLKILQIFNQIMFDSTWSHSEKDHQAKGLVDFSAVQEYLARSYLVDGSLYQLSPLIDIVAMGNDFPLKFYRDLKIQSARTTEECIEHSLKFIKCLLKRRKIGRMKVSLLEHALLDRTVHYSSQNDPVELVQVLGRYIGYENYRPLPLLATEVLTLLCAVAADWQPRPPSFAGYFGLDAYNFVSSIVRLLRDDRPSTSAHEELQTALYNLVTMVIATQPGLGAMLLTGEASRPTLPSSVTELLASTVQPPATGQDLSKLSVLIPALALLVDWRGTLDSKPTTLPAAMRLLDALWQNAPQYMVILDKLRARAEFWNALNDVFTDEPVVPSEEPFVGCEESTLSEDHDEVRRFCYSKLVRTYALRILAFEVYFTRGVKESPVISSVVKRIFKTEKADGGIALFTDDSRLPYRSDLTMEVMELANSLNIPIAVPAYKLRSWSDDLDVDAQFGDNFIYDLDLLRAKLRGHIQYRADEADQESYAEFLSRLCALNHNRSMTDAHFSLVRAWKQFIQVVSTAYLARSSSQAKVDFDLSAEHVYKMMQGLTDTLMDDHRQDNMVIKYRSEISNLLLFLVTVWGDLSSKKGRNPGTAKCAVDIVNRFHRCMATEYYELGPPGVFSEFPFHIELLAAIVVGLRVLRANTDTETTKDAEMRQTLQNLLPVVCKGLSLMLKGLGKDRFAGEMREINIALSCLSELTGFSEMLDPSTSISIMDRHEVIPLLVVVFQKAVSSSFYEWPSFAHDVMSVMLTIAESALGAERLAVENMLVCLSNNSLSPALTKGAIVPYVDQRRNPWHKVWCAMLSVAAKIVPFLGGNATLVEETTGFIRVYQNQITRAIDVSADGDVTLGRIEEIIRITELFYALGSWADRPNLNGSQAEMQSPSYTVLGPFQDYALQLVGYFAYLFDNPHEMHHRISPACRVEKDLNDNEPVPWEKSGPSSGSKSEVATRASNESSEVQDAGKSVYTDVTRGMLRIVRNVIVYLRLATNADHMIVSKDDSDSTATHIFQATMSVHGGQGATMGTLFGLVRRMTTLLRQVAEARRGGDAVASGTSNVETTLCDAAMRIPPIEIVLIAESAFVLALTQLALYRRNADTDELLKELVGEVELTVRTIEAALKDAKEHDSTTRTNPGTAQETATWSRKEIEKTFAFLKILDGFRLSEF